MADQTVVEKMSELKVNDGKKVMINSLDRLHLSHISRLAASLATDNAALTVWLASFMLCCFYLKCCFKDNKW